MKCFENLILPQHLLMYDIEEQFFLTTLSSLKWHQPHDLVLTYFTNKTISFSFTFIVFVFLVRLVHLRQQRRVLNPNNILYAINMKRSFSPGSRFMKVGGISFIKEWNPSSRLVTITRTENVSHKIPIRKTTRQRCSRLWRFTSTSKLLPINLLNWSSDKSKSS